MSDAALCAAAFGWSPLDWGDMDFGRLSEWAEIAKEKMRG